MSDTANPSTTSPCKQKLIQKPDESEATSPHLQCLADIRHWVRTEAGFHGRTDDEFLLMFLRGCKFKMEKTRIKMTTYYENRRRLPRWLTNRNLDDNNIRSLLQLMTTTAISDTDSSRPTVLITILSRDRPSSIPFDDYVKVYAIIFETVVRRPNTQNNGIIWISDCRNYPLWLVPRFFSPFFIKDLVNTFVRSNAVRYKSMELLNIPTITTGFWTMAQPFLGRKFKTRVHFYRSDWTQMFDNVPIELVPEEYGGRAGPIKYHDDEFLKEVLSYTEYFLEDDKYGLLAKN